MENISTDVVVADAWEKLCSFAHRAVTVYFQLGFCVSKMSKRFQHVCDSKRAKVRKLDMGMSKRYQQRGFRTALKQGKSIRDLRDWWIRDSNWLDCGQFWGIPSWPMMWVPNWSMTASVVQNGACLSVFFVWKQFIKVTRDWPSVYVCIYIYAVELISGPRLGGFNG